jgi:APA family basic amino acid/polyamine antiporter
VITLFGALTNSEIASMYPQTGGQYIYFQKMYGSFFAFLYGWGAFSVFQTGSISAVAYVFAEYASEFFPGLNAPVGWAEFAFSIPWVGTIQPFPAFGVKCLGCGLIASLTIVNYFGVKLGGLVQNIMTIAKVAAMAFLAVIAFVTPGAGSAANLTSSSSVIQPGGWALALALAAALQGAFWAYDGWNKITYIAGEVKDAQRTLPKALIAGMTIVMLIYLVVTIAYAWVLPVDEMAKSRLVAADAAEKCFSGGAKWIAVTVMISTFGTANAIILASARVYFSMARDKVFPGALGKAHPRFRTPSAALAAQAAWGALLVFSGTFDMLTDTLIFVSWLFYVASAAGVFILRRREPEVPRPFRVPGYPWVPLAFILFGTIFLVMTVYNDWTAYHQAKAAGKPALLNFAFGIGLLLLGSPVYWICRRGRPGVIDPTAQAAG